jgi:phosphoserine aminotransferase
MQVFNFSPGPAVLPATVLAQARDELLDWHGSGMSVMEMSHRGKEFMSIAAAAERICASCWRFANYKVLFLQGGATAAVRDDPMNLLRGNTAADYVHTGEWAKKAIARRRSSAR